ncbi:MAG: DUF3011 domain-containing protein [Blastocatellia bacterium]|nr:DUF3011 domain-containing protein [Blastocatellia bacterium]
MRLRGRKIGMSGLTQIYKLTFVLAILFIAGSLPATRQSGAVASASYAFQELRCDSNDGKYHLCPADTRRGVSLVRQRSDASCIQNRTWGYNRQGIWVNNGCRADFALGAVGGGYGRGPGGGGGYGRGPGREGGYGRGGGGSTQIFRCESGDDKRHYCAEGAVGRVRLVKQYSGSPCIEGRTFGRDRSGFFVDQGCRADFEVDRR